ncbi:hypothetical protein TNCV_2619751 [Trichonephila clavipes]|uniref:Uncharacterized protein n=1 Tax=Trichonephila clavipes TaxID=2585209 RepID=A0A8X6WIF4_TRICX|nr:hypothetical protein TNCV_2619751 [Trichonephila clavipes]
MTGMIFRNSFVSVQKSSQREIISGYYYNGQSKFKKVSSEAKINALYCEHNILEPIFEKEIPALYVKDIDEVELHVDKAARPSQLPLI